MRRCTQRVMRFECLHRIDGVCALFPPMMGLSKYHSSMVSALRRVVVMVDHVASVLAAGIIDEMAKKIKLKPQQVKNAFMLFVKSTLVNPTLVVK